MNASIPPSPPWGTSTKFLASLIFVVLIGGLLLRFHQMVVPLMFAFIVAYLLNPVVGWLSARTGLSWGTVVNLVYLALIIILLAVLTAAGFAIEQEIVGLYSSVVDIVTNLPAQVGNLLAHPLYVGPFVLNFSTTDLKPLYDQLQSAVQPALSRTGEVVGSLASSTAEAFGWMAFVLVFSYYLLSGLKTLLPTIERIVPNDYVYDVRRLIAELGPIWNAFLRGQITLALLVGTLIGLSMMALGVRDALVLALLAALMAFIPMIGPLVSIVTGTLVAFFQPGNWLGLPPLYFAGVVIVIYSLVQQLQDNILGPRIIGRSLKLHPAIILIGAVIAATLAGIVGLLLSAPTIASLRLFGGYAYRKLLDLDPWPPLPEPEPAEKRERPRWLERWFPKKKMVGDF